MHVDLERFIPELYERLGEEPATQPEVLAAADGDHDAEASAAAQIGASRHTRTPSDKDRCCEPGEGGDDDPLRVPTPKRVKRAIMDVTLQAPGFESMLLVDVSIRSAAAARYSASSQAGHAAAAGEKEKMKRYGPLAMPLVFESAGRLGANSVQSLHTIISVASAARLCSSHSVVSWRARCERAVHFSVADAALRACGQC